MTNTQEDIIVKHDTSEYRDAREFERYTMIRTSASEPYDRGLVEDVTRPVRNTYVIWGKIRVKKRFELEHVQGVFDDGSLILEYKFPMRDKVPQVNDFVELHGVTGRQPRMRYLVNTILPQSSITIGRCVITPVGNEGVPGGET